jgi:ribonuclease P protein component
VTNEFRFPKSSRLLRTAEYDRVFERRRSQGNDLLVVYGCENNLPTSRLGLVVSRKCGNAVVRARWKRCLREAFRLSQHELPAGLDLVVLPRGGAVPTTAGVRQALVELTLKVARRLGPPAKRG